MGKLEIKGMAERTVDYDLMRIRIAFHARKSTPSDASAEAMRECEDFLSAIKAHGFDISGFALKEDEVSEGHDYRNNDMVVHYQAARGIELYARFDMKAINKIRAITNKMESRIEFSVNYALSDENDIKEDLMMEALRDAKTQAEKLAGAIDQKVISLVSADKHGPRRDVVSSGEVLCINSLLETDDLECYENSDELKVTHTTLSEEIFTVWEIG